jgi:Fic family protein
MFQFAPIFTITPHITNDLMQIESMRERMEALPVHPTLLVSLRESARLFSTHYSTMIEGNRLTQEQVDQVCRANQHFAGRERDEAEVKGYYVALKYIEQWIQSGSPLTERIVQQLHALVMAGGKTHIQPSPYRDGQNVIRDSLTGGIVYMPPEAKDVAPLMKALVKWLKSPAAKTLPVPLQAGIAHYQFATIHPYYDGNGRTARLLTSAILHQGGYALKGLYALEEYYARDLPAYYRALDVGGSHNYYFGRETADITRWIGYFIAGMAESFVAVVKHATQAAQSGVPDYHDLLQSLEPIQRRAIEIFALKPSITSQEIQETFGHKPRTARALLSRWVKEGFLVVLTPAKKNRTYGLSPRYATLKKMR